MNASDEGVIDRIRAVARLVMVGVVVGCSQRGEEAPVGLAIAVEVGRLGQLDLWPDFDPAMIPLAVYDGERTILLGHPAPPPEFARDSVIGGWSHAGRHPAVESRGHARIGDVWTVTIEATDTSSVETLALRAVHEAFHVVQRERHPDWLLDTMPHRLPDPDVDQLAGRRLENLALARALAARPDEKAACWARAAILERRTRHAHTPSMSAWEQRAELEEGLANYIEKRAADKRLSELPLEAGFAPGALLDRARVTGIAFAFLLDRLRPDWREQLEHRTASLDGLLTEAIGTAGACSFRESEREAERERADREIRGLAGLR